MALVNLKCPNCGGSIQMDDARETGFCMYCGEKFLTKEEVQRVLVQHSGNVEVSRKNEIENLLIRLEEKADLLISNYQVSVSEYFDQFRIIESNYIEKILDLDAKNQEAIKIKSRIVEEADKRSIEKNKRDKEAEEKATDKIFFQGLGITIFLILIAIITLVLIYSFDW